MPVLAGSSYNTAGDISQRIRTILNDSEVVGGDVITDTNPATFDLINAGFERVQLELAKVGVEVATAEAWLIGLPTMPTVDPEARLVINDAGTTIVYPNGVGNAVYNAPQLPLDLILPLKLWERQNGTTDFCFPMCQPNDGLRSRQQNQYLIDWMWESDALKFHGALQSQDLKIKYEKHLGKLSAATDPVPIRGVVNAAAYFSAKIFADSRGAAIAPECKASGQEEIFLLQQVSARRRQRKQVRRRPYSGGSGTNFRNL